MPVRFCSSFNTFATASRFLFDSAKRLAFRRNVAVVEAVKRRAEFFDEFKRHARAVLRVANGAGAVVPRTLHRARAERIAAGAAERVPINHGETQMLAHRFARRRFRRRCNV